MDILAQSVDPADLLPQRNIGYRLSMLRHAWIRRLEASIAATGLTHMQFFVMRVVQHVAALDGVPSQTHIADLLQIDRMTISKVVRTLEGRGLIARAVHPADPRANSVAITVAGYALLREASGLANAAADGFFDRLGPERKRAFSAMLDDLLSQDSCPLAQENE